MASISEIQNLLEQQNDILSALDDATALSNGMFDVNGVRYSSAQLQKTSKTVKANIKILKKVLEPYTKQSSSLDGAKARLRRAEEIAANPAKELPTGYNLAEVRRNVETARQAVAVAQSRLNMLERQPVETPTGVVSVPGVVSASAGVAGPQGPISGVAGGVGMQGAAGVQKPAGATGATGATGAAGGARAGTGTGARTPSKDVQPAPKPKVDWEAAFKRQFPKQAWMFDLDRSKYADVFKLFKRAYTGQMWKTTEGQQRFLAELNNTTFFKELQTKQTVGTIKSLVGDLGFEETNFNKFLVTASNMGWEGDTLKQEVYREAFRKDTTTGKYANEVAVKRAKESADWLSIKKIGTDFFSTVDDSTIENTLTGGITIEDVARQQRTLAKTKYAHLGDLIDQGFSLDQLAADYKQMAAGLLEKDPNAIDMSLADYEVALNFNDNGQKRMLTTGEWQKLLKTDDRYGWGNTEQAQRTARNIAQSLVTSLGKFG